MFKVAGQRAHRDHRAPAGDNRHTGLRRVDWVRLSVDDTRVGDTVVGAEAVGVGFRLPASCPISLAVAAELIASGVPCVTRHVAKGA
jgi:hypothetical protein